jgi:hypothetical protein
MNALLADYKGIDQKEMRKRIESVKAAAYQGDPKQAIGHVIPSNKEALRAAYTEIFESNPVREGKLMSMPIMLGMAAIAGGALLSSPIFYVPFGMLESLGGLVRAKLASKQEDIVWQNKVVRLTNELNANVGTLALQV